MATKRFKIAGYSRFIKSNLTRMFENVLDWEHLPHLHPRSFTSIQCLHAGLKSLECEVGLWPRALGLRQKIRVHACQRRQLWVVTVQSGFMRGLTICSRVRVSHDHLFKVTIDFLAPRGKWYWCLMAPLLWLTYHRIYQEDSAMMITRQDQLNQLHLKKKLLNPVPVFIGEVRDIKKKLPYFFQLEGHLYGLIFQGNQPLSYDAVCPHMLRPLTDCPIEGLKITCPWHGYEFCLVTGKATGRDLTLRTPPQIIIENGQVFAKHQTTNVITHSDTKIGCEMSL